MYRVNVPDPFLNVYLTPFSSFSRKKGSGTFLQMRASGLTAFQPIARFSGVVSNGNDYSLFW